MMLNWAAKEYKCPEKGCNKVFITKWTLKRHSVIHQSVDKSAYKCSQCEKSFSRKDSLERHEQMCHNSKIKLYRCTKNGCGKFFSFKSTLNRHKLSHTETYECEDCGNLFKRKDNLARHKVLHKETKEQQCVIEIKENNNKDDHTYATNHR